MSAVAEALVEAPVAQSAPAAASTPAAGTRAASAASDAHAGEYLTFRLGEEEYGIDILRVQEIRSYEQPTKIVNAPPYLRGVVDLRGVIVPIIDLRLKLNCDTADFTTFTVVMVLNIGGRTIGTVVDSVSDVVRLSADSIKPAPKMSSAIDASFINGIATTGERMLVLVDIAGMMSADDWGTIA